MNDERRLLCSIYDIFNIMSGAMASCLDYLCSAFLSGLSCVGARQAENVESVVQFIEDVSGDFECGHSPSDESESKEQPSDVDRG